MTINTTKKIALMTGTVLMFAVSHAANAAIDNIYYVADATAKSHFDVYNDGRNTFIEAVPGLIIRGATVDGPKYIVNGVPSQISAQLNGRQITVVRGYPPQPVPEKVAPVDAKSVLNRIEQMTADIKRLEVLSGTSENGANVKEANTPAAGAGIEEWVVPPGASMRDLIAEFAQRAGWSVDINFNDVQTGLPADLNFSGGRKINGTFTTAIIDTFSALPPSSSVMAELVPDNNPPTLFIYRKGSVK